MYAQGRGVPRDIKQAVEWYTRAAQQGLAMAQFNLGTLYSTGGGIPRDEAKAADWLERAANKGIAQAQFNLAILYEYGRGVRLNAAKALHWYHQAEEFGYAPATARRRHLQQLLEVPAGSAATATRPPASALKDSPQSAASLDDSRAPSAVPAPPPGTTSPADSAQESVTVAASAQTQVPAGAPETTAPADHAADHWLAALDDQHYTLQLASYVDRKSAQQFIHKLNVGTISGIYASTKQGKRWYSVVYGDYTSYQQAKAAVARLPASFRGLKPWVRKVALIKQEMQ